MRDGAATQSIRQNRSPQLPDRNHKPLRLGQPRPPHTSYHSKQDREQRQPEKHRHQPDPERRVIESHAQERHNSDTQPKTEREVGITFLVSAVALPPGFIITILLGRYLGAGDPGLFRMTSTLYETVILAAAIGIPAAMIK